MPYDDATRQKVIADALASDSAKAARKHGINEKTVRSWVRELERATPTTMVSNPTIEPSHKTERVLVIPDLHCPYHHPDALAFLQCVRDIFKTGSTVCLGDEVDMHSISRWPSNPDSLSPGMELAAAREALIPFFREFPEVKVCTSNHTIRPMLAMFNSRIPEALYPTYATMLQSPDGWQWEDRWIVDDVTYCHGHPKSGQNAHKSLMREYKRSVVIGHIHRHAGVAWESDHFAMNAGCLIDPTRSEFSYARMLAIRENLGCGVVIGGRQAFFVRMALDEHNRWIGKL